MAADVQEEIQNAGSDLRIAAVFVGLYPLSVDASLAQLSYHTYRSKRTRFPFIPLTDYRGFFPNNDILEAAFRMECGYGEVN